VLRQVGREALELWLGRDSEDWQMRALAALLILVAAASGITAIAGLKQ